MRRTVTLAILLLGLACPAGALAQGSPFAPLPPAEPPPITVDERESVFGPQDDGLDTWQTLLIVFGGVAVIGGIALAIMGDARRHAPTSRPATGRVPGADGEAGNRASEQHRRQKARNRQKAKAARAARKRSKRGR